jgi:predicted ATPase/class 3 adenylate cyclase
MASAMVLPAGTVTLLFSDIEGSTRLLELLGTGFDEVLDEHRRIVRGAIVEHAGVEVRTEGDAFFVAFSRAGGAVAAAVAAQRALAAHAWPDGVELRVRMGVHTGEPRVVGGDYVGMDVHRAARICAAAHGGQVVVSETTKKVVSGQAIAGVHMRDLGVHRLKDLARPMRLYQVAGEGLMVDFPALRSVERSDPNRLGWWVAPTPLFGRDDDLEALAGLVREVRTRLVTLVGPGGVGKTRLALEAVRRLAGDFADGARFVGLAAVSEPEEVASAIGRALAAPINEGESSRDALLRLLADRHLLLVLDNLEHVIEAAPLAGELVAACSDLTIVCTSREPTRLAAERVYRVRPLEVPAASGPIAADELERYGAVAMFCDRARAREADFALDDSTAPHVSAICRKLDGLPLALELAAARVGLLPPAELAVRLDHALAVLVRGARDAPARQRTLRATIDWSCRLLTAAEQRAFARMAVFAAGATVAVAQEVTGASLDDLDSLVGKHLLERREDRLFMLETIRDYALERLSASPDADAVQQRLAAWSLSFAREATPHLVRASREAWLPRLDAELPNLVGAVSWAIAAERAETALRLVGVLGEYWWDTSRQDDGLPWISAALDMRGEASPQARATALLYRARLSDVRNDRAFRSDLEASLALYRADDDAAGVASCLGHLAVADSWVGRHEEARLLSDEALQFAERSRDALVLARAFAESAQVAATYEDAAARATVAATRLAQVGDIYELARICGLTGYKAIANGHYRAALDWLDRALEAARGLKDNARSAFFIRGNQGLAWLFLDDLDEAARAFCDSLAACREAGTQHLVDETLLGLAAADARRGDLARAARLCGAAGAHETVGRSREEDVIWSRVFVKHLTPARLRYGPARWDAAEQEGASLTVDEAIDLALAPGRNAAPAPTT